MKKLGTLLGALMIAACAFAGSGQLYQGTVTVAAGATTATTPVTFGQPSGSDLWIVDNVETRISSGTGTGLVTFAIANIGSTIPVAITTNLVVGTGAYRARPKYSWSYSQTVGGYVVTGNVAVATSTTQTIPMYSDYMARTMEVTVTQPATNVATVYQFSISVK